MSEGEMVSRLGEIVQKAVAVKTSKKWKELQKSRGGTNSNTGKKRNNGNDDEDDDPNKTIMYDSDDEVKKGKAKKDDDDPNKTIMYGSDDEVKKGEDDDLNETMIFEPADYADKGDEIDLNKTIVFEPESNYKERGMAPVLSKEKERGEGRKQIFKGFRMILLLQSSGDEERERVRTAIASNGGVVEEELSGDSNVTHIVVDTREWDILFDDCLEVAQGVVFVHYDWILKCASQDSLVKIDPYMLKKPR